MGDMLPTIGPADEAYVATLPRRSSPEELQALLEQFWPLPKHADLLKVAFKLFKAGARADAKVLAEAWLKLAHNAARGSIVLVSGWVEPREILIDDFELSWHDLAYDDFERCCMVFRGPTAFTGGVAVKLNVTPLTASVRCLEGPGARLLRKFPDRFATTTPCVPV